MTRGFRNIDYFIAIVYFCNYGLEISFNLGSVYPNR